MSTPATSTGLARPLGDAAPYLNQNLCYLPFVCVCAAPPTAVGDTFLQTPDAETVIPAPGLLGNDTVSCVSPVEVLLETPPKYGQVTALSDDGSFTYAPSEPAQADSFTYLLRCPDTGLVS